GHIAFPQITACSTAQRFGTITYAECGQLVITAAAIENDPSGAFILQPLSLPDTLLETESDTFYVDFDPKGNPAAYNPRIRVSGYIEVEGIRSPVDSIVRINAIAVGVPPKLTASTGQVVFPDVSVCGT